MTTISLFARPFARLFGNNFERIRSMEFIVNNNIKLDLLLLLLLPIYLMTFFERKRVVERKKKKKRRISSIDPFAELRSPVGSRVALPGRGLVGVLFMLGRSRTKCCFHASSTTSSSVEYSHTDTKEKSASSKTTTTFSRSFNTEPGKRKSNLDLINGGRYVEPAAAHIIYSTRRDKSAGIRGSLFISPQVFYCLVVQHV